MPTSHSLLFPFIPETIGYLVLPIGSGRRARRGGGVALEDRPNDDVISAPFDAFSRGTRGNVCFKFGASYANLSFQPDIACCTVKSFEFASRKEKGEKAGDQTPAIRDM